MIRTAGFPEIEDIEKRVKRNIDTSRCPLCKEELTVRIWLHLMLQCMHDWVQSHREKYLQEPIERITNTSKFIGIRGRVGTDNLTSEEDHHSMQRVGFALVGCWDHICDDAIPTYLIGLGQLDQQATGLETRGYIFVAQFLQKVATVYLRTFRLREYMAGNEAQMSWQ